MNIQGVKITKWHYISWVFIAIAGVLFYITPSKNISVKKEVNNLSVEAFVICKDLVKEKLLAPSTAKFHSLDFKVWDKSKQSYKIRSYVDSQNQNGVMIRTNWNCYIKYKGEGEVYDPINWEHELEFI